MVDEYKEKIIQMIHRISDSWVLEQIYKFVVNMTKEG